MRLRSRASSSRARSGSMTATVAEERSAYDREPVHNVEAVKSAARAAIVIPAVFAVANEVIKQPQTSIVAAFGSFALLVLTDFAGPWRTRLAAYVGLACTGAAMITLGTLCSRTA